MCVCSRTTRAGTSPAAACGANAAARRAFQPSWREVDAHAVGEPTCRTRVRRPDAAGHRPAGRRSWLVFSRHRSTSATLQAWATQPRGVYGASASKISLIEPMHASPRCALEAVEQPPRAGAVVGMHLQPGVDERADQPGPDGALVIGGVARAQVAVVARLVVADGRARASAGRPASAAARARRRSTGSQRARSSTGWSSEIGEDLVRPAGRVVAVLAVDDVVEVAAPRRTRSAG